MGYRSLAAQMQLECGSSVSARQEWQTLVSEANQCLAEMGLSGGQASRPRHNCEYHLSVDAGIGGVSRPKVTQRGRAALTAIAPSESCLILLMNSVAPSPTPPTKRPAELEGGYPLAGGAKPGVEYMPPIKRLAVWGRVPACGWGAIQC